MQPAPSCLTLMVLVDALRPDYLAHMPYLRGLAGQAAVGRLRECFGFVPRAAYFGGLDAASYGFTNMFCFDPARSPFSLARYLPSAPQGVVVEHEAGLRPAVEAAARERLGPFAKNYASSAEIPLAFLPCFDLVERRAPWDPDPGYESLFAQLDRAGLPWHECSWPGTNRLADASDDGIVRQVLEDLRPEHRFSYVHLQQLDGQGHVHGPQSSAMRAQIRAMDERCRTLIEGLRPRYDRLNLVLFGDHGMVNVTRTLDVWEILRGLDLVFGADYAYFLDSSMVRFWFYHSGARQQVEAALAAVEGGRVLGPGDLEQYGIAGCDERNAQLVFLADPGVLIFPNFFQGHGEPIKGMHGYDPDCPDNLGFFMVSSPDRPQLAGRDVGRVDPPRLFHLARQLAGLDSEPAVELLLENSSMVAGGRFTTHPDPDADGMVAGHMDLITRAVRERLGEFEAVILTGSFGRGEGGVCRDEEGRLRPVNDYDLLVVSPHAPRTDPGQLGRELAAQLGVDYVDLGWTDGAWEGLPLTVSHYDLRHGSQVVAGREDILESLPDFASAEMPVYEAVKLLLNRSAGLLTGLRGHFSADAPLESKASRYLVNQVVKARLAMADWHLIRWQGYDSSYRLRRERFASLAPGAGLEASRVEEICAAFDHKCRPDYEGLPDPLGQVARLQEQLVPDLIHSISLMTETGLGRLDEALDRYVQFMSGDAGRRRAENALALGHPELSGWWRGGPDPGLSYRHLIYAAVPPVLLSFPAGGGPEEARTRAFAQARRRLEPWLPLPPGEALTPDNWEALRALVVRAWFALCH